MAVAAANQVAAAALDRAVARLLALQAPDGWWKGELQTNVSMDAEDLLLRHFLGIRGERETDQAANWIRSQQRADGTWANFHGGPGELSTTISPSSTLASIGQSQGRQHRGHKYREPG